MGSTPDHDVIQHADAEKPPSRAKTLCQRDVRRTGLRVSTRVIAQGSSRTRSRESRQTPRADPPPSSRCVLRSPGESRLRGVWCSAAGPGTLPSASPQSGSGRGPTRGAVGGEECVEGHQSEALGPHALDHRGEGLLGGGCGMHEDDVAGLGPGHDPVAHNQWYRATRAPTRVSPFPAWLTDLVEASETRPVGSTRGTEAAGVPIVHRTSTDG